MKSKKGMSGIIETIIIIGIALFAIGIVWYALNEIVIGQTENIALSEKCLGVDVRATSVDCSNPSVCSVILNRKTGGDKIGGVKMIFRNETDSTSSTIDVLGNIAPLQTITKTGIDSEIVNATSIGVTAYFEDSSGNEQLCSQAKYYTFG
ncbi:MAG: hypothetical protein V1788_03455 [Nanoarchaeota archaeon]|nr:hypothetical protein [Nanoarchaeota archaeon]